MQRVRNSMNLKFSKLNNLIQNFLIKGIMYLTIGKKKTRELTQSLNKMIERAKYGQDPYLRGAPALIILISKSKTAMRNLDAGIAGYHINLAAESLGLGTCWIGFHSILAKYFTAVRSASGILKKAQILASIVIGYPLLKYRKNISRREPQIQFLESNSN